MGLRNATLTDMPNMLLKMLSVDLVFIKQTRYTLYVLFCDLPFYLIAGGWGLIPHIGLRVTFESMGCT